MGNAYDVLYNTSALYNSLTLTSQCTSTYLWGYSSLLEVIITNKIYYCLCLFSVYERSASPIYSCPVHTWHHHVIHLSRLSIPWYCHKANVRLYTRMLCTISKQCNKVWGLTWTLRLHAHSEIVWAFIVMYMYASKLHAKMHPVTWKSSKSTIWAQVVPPIFCRLEVFHERNC